MGSWAEALGELERIDFELARSHDVNATEPWMKRREGVLRELGELAVGGASQAERVRLARAADRGRELQEKWRRVRETIRTEAENAFAAQLLVRALAPEQRGRLVNLQV